MYIYIYRERERERERERKRTYKLPAHLLERTVSYFDNKEKVQNRK